MLTRYSDRQTTGFFNLYVDQSSPKISGSHIYFILIFARIRHQKKKQHHSDMIGGSYLTEQVHYSPLRKQSSD